MKDFFTDLSESFENDSVQNYKVYYKTSRTTLKRMSYKSQQQYMISKNTIKTNLTHIIV